MQTTTETLHMKELSAWKKRATTIKVAQATARYQLAHPEVRNYAEAMRQALKADPSLAKEYAS